MNNLFKFVFVSGKVDAEKYDSSVVNHSLEVKIYDIGEVIEQTPKAFTEHEKYIILKNHFHPSEKYEFKKTFNHGCYRSCKREHLSDCFVYSPQKDGVFCIYCVLFLSENK